MGVQRPRLPIAERRRRLLEQARAAFARHGFAGSSFDSIASAAGLTPSEARRVFADSAALVRGVAAEFHARLCGDPSPPDQALARFHALLEAFRKDARSSKSPAQVLLRLLAEDDDEPRMALADALGPTALALADLVRAGQQEGVFRRSLDPQHAAWELLRAMFGQALLAGVEPAAPVKSEPATGPDVLLHGLLKTDV